MLLYRDMNLTGTKVKSGNFSDSDDQDSPTETILRRYKYIYDTQVISINILSLGYMYKGNGDNRDRVIVNERRACDDKFWTYTNTNNSMTEVVEH